MKNLLQRVKKENRKTRPTAKIQASNEVPVEGACRVLGVKIVRGGQIQDIFCRLNRHDCCKVSYKM